MSEGAPNGEHHGAPLVPYRPIGAGPSGRGLHGLGPASKPGASGRFGTALLIVAAIPFGFGSWGFITGIMSLRWPLAEGLITHSTLRLSEPDSETRRMSASVDIRYRYNVDGVDYSGAAIAPSTFGAQNSSEASAQHERYQSGTAVRVAYDPKDPSVAYLEPGPSSTSMLLVGVGLFIGLPGLMIRRLAELEKRKKQAAPA
jgi:hypothetical protein